MPTATDTRMLKTFFGSLANERESFGAATQSHYENDSAVSGALVPPETQPPVGVFLCTEAGRRFTGYSFQMSGRNIGVVTPHAEVEFVAPAADEWTLDDVADRLPPLLEKKPSLMQS
jgi:hypothetical protein